jgi:hypothetical protein
MHLFAIGVSVVRKKIHYFYSCSGATASHTFVLETKTQGRFQGSPAVITYRVPTKTALQVLSFTSTVPTFLMLCILYYPLYLIHCNCSSDAILLNQCFLHVEGGLLNPHLPTGYSC